MRRRLLAIVLAGIMTITSVAPQVYAEDLAGGLQGDIEMQLGADQLADEADEAVLGELIEEPAEDAASYGQLLDENDEFLEAADVSDAGTAEGDELIEDPQLEEDLLAAADLQTASMIWINDDQETAYATLNEAVTAAVAGDVIHVGTGTSVEALAGSTVNKAVTVDIAGDVTLTGTADQTGITLARNSGAVLQCTSGATLTMSGFKTAIDIAKGTTLKDGKYVLTDNTTGLRLSGDVTGSSKDALVVNASSSGTKDDGSFPVYLYGGGKINVTGASITADYNGGNYISKCCDNNYAVVQFKDSEFLTTRIRMQYIYLNFDNTKAVFDGKGSTSSAATGYGLSYAEGTNILWTNHSDITYNNWTRCGITTTAKELRIDNGTKITLNGDGLAGINVRPQDSPWDKYTSLVLDNAIIESDGTTANLVAGASSYAGFHTVQVNGQVICTGDTVMNTTASSGKENLGAGGSNNFIVTGGSYKIYYNPSYYNSYGSSVPVNGADHGNESLSYFQLSDPSRTSVSTIDKNGTAYTYPVANASADGQKYIWVPGEDVTFKLNQTGARFADKTTSDKKIKAIRGGTFSDAVKANGVSTTVDNPTCTGLKFAGWYTDADCTDGNEFDPAAVTVTAPLTVYAKWIPSDTFGISYHSNLSYGSSDYDVEGEGADRSMTVMSYEDVIAANAAFKPKNGYTFKEWNTKADGTGTSYAAADTITFAAGESLVQLYAQWDIRTFKVTLSANGGTFADTGTLRTKYANDFTFSEDGETATFKIEAEPDWSISQIYSNSPTAITYGDLQPSKTGAVKTVDGVDCKLSSNYYWYYRDASGTEKSLFYSSNFRNYVITDDITFYVKYTEPVKVTFDANGGRGTMAPQTAPNGSPFSLNANTYTRAGYDFLGWSKKADATTATYTDAGRCQVSANTTLYAIWQKKDAEVIEMKDIPLQADIWGISRETSKNTQYVEASEVISLTGSVNTAAIKQQMAAFMTQFGESDSAAISLSETACEFTAVLTLPAGIDATTVAVSADGFGDGFAIRSTDVEGQTVTIVLALNAKGIDAFDKLEEAVNGTEEWMDLKVSGPKMPESFTADQRFTVTGTVTGTFHALAETAEGIVKQFDFGWSGTQWAEGKDNNAADDTTIQYTLTALTPMKEEGELPADIRIGNDSENTAVYQVLKGETLDFRGDLDVSSIKAMMAAIESQFTDEDQEKIAVDIEAFGFTAVINFPEGLSIPAELEAEQEEFGGFVIDNTVVEGQKVTVTFKLAEKATTYPELKAAVDAAGEVMTLVIPGVKADIDGTATVTAQVTGAFKATADNVNGTRKAYDFSWKAIQKPEGKDAAATADDNSIRFTLQANKPMEGTLPADILIGEDTEHDRIYAAKAGDVLDYTGALNVKTIQAQMQAVQVMFPQAVDHSKILVDVSDFGFKAVFTVPDGLVLPDGLTKDDITAEDFGNGFEVTEAAIDGQTVTVTFGLTDVATITNFAQIETAVNAAGGDDGWMRVTIPGITVDENVADGARLTVKGSVEGTFTARAQNDGPAKLFAFHWSAEQWADGADAMTPDSRDITFTAMTPEVLRVEANLNGDILVGENTEHEKVYTAFAGDELAFTGALLVTDIKDQMAALEAQYPNVDHDQIAVDVKEFGFTATFTIPEGMSLPEELTAEAVDFGVGFDVKSVTAEDNTVTVELGLAHEDDIETYTDLENVVDAAGDEKNWMKVILPGVKVDEDVEDGTRLTVTGTVTGHFKATASTAKTLRMFDFAWTAAQWADGRDAAVVDSADTSIRFTLETPTLIEGTLPGDILIGEDTEHERIYPTEAGEELDYTGALNISTIKKQMSAIQMLYPNAASEDIYVEVKEFGFTAVFTVPTGMTIPADLSAADIATENFGNGFAVTDASVDGQTVTVKFGLASAEQISDFSQIEAAVNGAGNDDGWMKVTIPGIKVAEDASNGSRYTVTGTVEGTFRAYTEYDVNEKFFGFHWNAKQWEDGSDVIAPESVTIQFTAMIPELMQLEADLNGDILVGDDTEHYKVYETSNGAELEFTGALLVTDIKDQMAALESQYSHVDHDKIAVNVEQFGFTATFTVPDGLTIQDGIVAEAADFGDGFKVESTTVSGKTVTVELVLADSDSIRTYTDLEAVVDPAGGEDNWMKVILPGITVDDDVEDGNRLTVVGTVVGHFLATAATDKTLRKFDFTWNAGQWAEGRDAIVTDTTDKTIQFTAEVAQYFYVYHRSDASIDTFRMKDYKDKTFDITPLVKAGYIYGGIYKNKEFTNPYSIDDDDFSGMEINPIAGTTYYLKEVDQAYLRASTSTTYDMAKNNKLKFVDLLLATDDTMYHTTGFIITENGETTVKKTLNNKLYEQYTVEKEGGAKKIHTAKTIYSKINALVTAGKTYGGNAANGGYLGYLAYNSEEGVGLEAGKSFDVQAFWITPDGVKVTSTTVKTVNMNDGTKNKGTGFATTNTPESQNAQHYSCTAMTNAEVNEFMEQ